MKNKLSKELNNSLLPFIKSKGIFEKNDIEFLDIIFNAIYDKISLLIFKFIFKAEKDHFLHPLLRNYSFF